MRRELSIIFALALSGTSGCTVAETACLTDTDCDQGQVCELEVCTASCTSNQECGDEEACVPRRDDDGRVCRIQIGNSENTENSDPGSTWVVLIRDESVADEASCASDSAPGADITGVSLEDLLGTRSGVAEIVLAGASGVANTHTASAHLDGVMLADACGEERLSLGCGGWAAMRFLDERGQPVILDTLSSQVRIQERGEICGDDTDEPYAIYVCSDANAVENHDDISSCTTLVGHGSGEQTFLLDAAVMMGG